LQLTHEAEIKVKQARDVVEKILLEKRGKTYFIKNFLTGNSDMTMTMVMASTIVAMMVIVMVMVVVVVVVMMMMTMMVITIII
jgi:ABC-type lipoprotein release transport system permease subunit